MKHDRFTIRTNQMERMIRGEFIDEDHSCLDECPEDLCFEEEWM